MPAWWLWDSAALLGAGAGLLVGLMINYGRRAVAEAQTASEPITIEASPVEQITVNLVGHMYEVTPPKSAMGMRLASAARDATEDPSKVFDVLMLWVDQAFGKSAKEIRKRLDTPADALDLQHIMALMEAVTERQTGNPTSSSSGT